VKCSILKNINILGAENDIFNLLKTLVETNKRMDMRIKKLEALMYKEKKKINVLEWLNKNRMNSITYSRFLDNIEIGEYELETIYEYGIIEGITKLLKENLNLMEEKPIICFEMKSYMVYVKCEEGWEKLESDEFKKNICYLQRKILTEFRNKNSIEKLKTDREHNIYNKRLRKICNSNFSIKINEIRNNIYRSTKVNINKIINYSFEY